MKLLGLPIVVLGIALATPMWAQSISAYKIGGRIPLGVESFRLLPDGHEFYLMASAENPTLEGLHRVADHSGHDRLLDADGKPVRYYPEHVQFRLTASDREKLLQDHPFDTHSKLSVPELLSRLRFRVKVFHELNYRYIAPAVVEDIGVPRSVPYDERIYRIGFDLGRIPITDRVVMEVLTPNGERLCKFHLDLL